MDQPSAPSRWTSPYLQLLIVIGGLALGLWTFVFLDLRHGREQLLAAARSELGNLVLAFAKETESSVKTIDITLLDLREHWQGDPAEFAATVRRRQAYLEKEVAFQVGIIDAQGMLIFSNLEAQAKPIDLSDREHFRVHRDRGGDTLFISKPLLGRVSKRWTIQFTRPISDRQGKFAGVIVLSVSPEYFYRFYQTIDLDSGSAISLLRGTGEVLSRYPNPDQALGQTIPDAPFLSSLAQESGTFARASRLDKVERLYAWRKLEQYNLVVALGYSLESIMAPQRRQWIKTGLAAAGLTLLLALVGYLKLKGLRHRQQVAQALAESEERWRFALEGVGDGVWDWNIPAGKVVFSRGWKSMLGHGEDEIGDSLEEWKSRVHPDDMAQVMQDVQAHFAGKTGVYVNEHRVRCKDGGWKWILDRGTVIQRDRKGNPLRMVGTHTDISSRKEMEDQLRNLATTDALTGLNNRRHFMEKLEEELNRVKRNSNLHASVLMADLDHFKAINDSFGHAEGDLVLKHFAALLQGELRQTDFAGRIGGEEFAILLSGTDQEGARQFAQRLCAKVERSPLPTDGPGPGLTVSIGVAGLEPGDPVPDRAMGRADKALYRAKENGRNQVAVAA